eukprot:tig00000215_g18671.t1
MDLPLRPFPYSGVPWLEITLATTLVLVLWDVYLDVRNRSRLQRSRIPVELAEHVNAEQHAKSRAYTLDKSTFGLWSTLYNLAFALTFTLCFVPPRLWDLSGTILHKCRLNPELEIPRSLVFVTVTAVMEFFIGLPWSLYFTFVIEQRHGFNKTTPWRFLTDTLKKGMLSALIGLPVVAALIWIIHWGGPLFFIYCWAFVAAVMVVMIYVYPIFIAPLFNKYTPLEEGPLRSSIEALAARLEYPLKKIYVVDGSTRSAHSNAYLYGFWGNKFIALYDTLLEQYKEDTEAIVAIVAHELGHWALSHTLKGMVTSLANTFLLFYTMGFVLRAPDVYRSFGFHPGPVVLGMIVFMEVIKFVNPLLQYLQNALTRRFEYQADEFAVKQGFGHLDRALIKIHLENASNLDPDPWYSAYNYSHPVLLERMRAIEAARAALDSKVK